jgi:hypothetical protein
LLQASGAAPINEADLSAPPEIEMKGEKGVKKEVAAAPSHVSAAIAGSFDEDADARGFMRPSDGGGGAADAGHAAEQLQICLDGIDPSDSSLKQFLQQSLTLAAAASAVKKFTVALSIYSQILEVVPKQVDALRGIAKIHECSPHLKIQHRFLALNDAACAGTTSVGRTASTPTLCCSATTAWTIPATPIHLILWVLREFASS